MVVKFSKYKNLLPYLIAQSKVETGDFTSHVYDVDNNMFGMKDAHKREETSNVEGTKSNDGGNYKRYATDTESIRDLFLYFDYVKFPTSVSSVEDFNSQLFSRGYYTTGKDHYLSLLKVYLK